MKHKLLFCSSFVDTKSPDEAFAEEFDAAKQAGFDTFLFNEDALVMGDVKNSLKGIPTFEQPTPVIYRGWMLKEKDYQVLYEAISRRNLYLVNSLDEYLNAHYLPRAYSYIQNITAKTLVFHADKPISEIAGELRIAFGNKPIILKDFVKSQKHYWHEAFYIPAADRFDDIERVTNNFLKLQDRELVGGLVYRAFIPFQVIGTHTVSGMPISKEVRVFVFNKHIFSIHPYWEGFQIQYDPNEIMDYLDDLVQTFPCPLFTIDLAWREDGDWMVVEVGDGQVSSIPDNRYSEFYKALSTQSGL